MADVDPTFGFAVQARSYYHLGQLDRAAAALHEWIARAPSFVAYNLLTWIELRRGNIPQALEHHAFSEVLASRVYDDYLMALAGERVYRFGRLGQNEDAERLFAELQERAATGPAPASGWVLAYLAIGDQRRALESLETVVERRDFDVPENIAQLKHNVFEDPVLDLPEFVEVRERLGFTDL